MFKTRCDDLVSGFPGGSCRVMEELGFRISECGMMKESLLPSRYDMPLLTLDFGRL